MAPALQTLNAEVQGKATVKFVNVWKNPNAAKDFPVHDSNTGFACRADGTPYDLSEEVSAQIQFTHYSWHNGYFRKLVVHRHGVLMALQTWGIFALSHSAI